MNKKMLGALDAQEACATDDNGDEIVFDPAIIDADKSGRVLTEARGSAKALAEAWLWVLRRIDPRDLRSHLNALDASERQVRQHQADALALENRKKSVALKGAETRARNEARKASLADHEAQLQRMHDLLKIRAGRTAARRAAEDARAKSLDNDEREAEIEHRAWQDECRRVVGDLLLGAMTRNASLRAPVSIGDLDHLLDDAMDVFFNAVEGRADRLALSAPTITPTHQPHGGGPAA